MLEILPKYYVLKQRITEMIDDEVYQANELIPSERELMAKYGVSRITVRKAIDDLVNAGYLYRIQGKGTYVKGDEFNQDLFQLTSCTEEIKKMGMTPTKKIIYFSIVQADKKRQKLFHIGEDDKLFSLTRVYFADRQPLNFTTTYLPCKYFQDLDKYNFEKDSVYEILESKYAVKIMKAKRTLEAVNVTEEIGEYLDMEENSPVLLFRGVTWANVNGTECPIETFKSYYRSDKFKFFINQAR